MIANSWQISARNTNKKTKNWLLQILAKNRGLTNPQKLKAFLNPKLEDILSTKLTDTQKAILRVEKAIKNKEKIIVYSDYDADGINATAIMWETLYDLGADVMPYVPHRIKEGYGLSSDAIGEHAKSGVKLIITVDHGVTAVKQVEHAKKLGMEVVITDHHLLPKVKPKSYAIVHTTELCGAGVAWRFAWDLVKKLKPSYKEKLLEKLELAAIATIADLVPLFSANRAIVKLGLAEISKTRRPGIKALISASGIKGEVGTFEIGHILAPRINAMGRIEHGLDSLRLLCAKNEATANRLAGLLSKTNVKRQDLTTQALEDASGLVIDEHRVGVIAHDTLHEGVIGLVASRLVERHGRPMIVISKGEVYSKGSARSISGFNIVEAIRSSSEFLVDAGGHPMAAGFTIETRYIKAFSEKINKYAVKNLPEELLIPKINVECELEVSDINKSNFEIIEMFKPYGVANPQPLFLTKNMVVEDIRTVGQTASHLKLVLSGFGAIAFNMGEKRAQLRLGNQMDVIYTISEDRFSGRDQLQLKIRDFRSTA